MSHYLKAVLDAVFGLRNFRNEIIWSYSKISNSDADKFLRAHDVILFYAKDADRVFFKTTFEEELTDRKKQLVRVGYNTKNQNGLRYLYIYDEEKVREKGIKFSDFDKVVRVDTKVGNPHNDVFRIPSLAPNAKENTRYPTQKPEALLARIIKAASEKGHRIFDPFCGCATTLVVANEFGRKWIGIDKSPKAADLVARRIKDKQGAFSEFFHRKDIPSRTDQGKIPRYNHPDNKDYLYGKQGGHCAGCGVHFQKRNLTIDHIIPRSQGGGDERDNLQLLCGHCNSTKGDRGMEYLKKILEMDPDTDQD